MSSTKLDPRVRTRRLLLRAPRSSDSPAIAAIFQNPAHTQFEPHKPKTPTPEHYAKKIKEWDVGREKGESCFMIVVTAEDDNDVVGFGGLNSIQDRDGTRVADMGVLIDQAHWRKGYGKEALTATIDYAFNEAECGEGLFETQAINAPFRALAKAVGLGGVEMLQDNDTECEYRFSKQQWQEVKAPR